VTDLETDYYTLGAAGIDGLDRIGEYLDASALDPTLLELVKLRASQINGCAHCLGVHAERLDALGEDRRRIDALAAWDEASVFTSRERAALAWTEAVTLIADGVPDECYEAARAAFTDEELVALTFAVCQINVYNRLARCFREPTNDA
jgi:AhpD family alkylhydroperoxidase